MSFLDVLLVFGAFVVSLAVHEWAHAFIAFQRGDPTGAAQGRMTLNPVPHLDLLGSIVMPVFGLYQAWASGTPVRSTWGYAKPVPYNPYLTRNPALTMTFVAGAGPASNLVLALGAALLLGVAGRVEALDGSAAIRLLEILVLLNVRLAVFNLLPFPPLDGASVLAGLLPRGGAAVMARIEPYGFFLLIALGASGLLGKMTAPVEDFLLGPLVSIARRPLLG